MESSALPHEVMFFRRASAQGSARIVCISSGQGLRAASCFPHGGSSPFATKTPPKKNLAAQPQFHADVLVLCYSFLFPCYGVWSVRHGILRYCCIGKVFGHHVKVLGHHATAKKNRDMATKNRDMVTKNRDIATISHKKNVTW